MLAAQLLQAAQAARADIFMSAASAVLATPVYLIPHPVQGQLL
jgi:hypothetical protein